MKSSLVSCAGVLALALSGWRLMPQSSSAAPAPATTSAPATQPVSLKDTYPGLASAGLTYARPADLPKGTLLKAGELTISERDLTDQIAKAPRELQSQLKKNAFFLLEQMATGRILLSAAKAEAGKNAPADERELIQGYLKGIVANVKVTDAEVADFFRGNQDMFGGASLDKVKTELSQYLLQQKQQEAVSRHIETLGQRMPIEVSAAWAKEQAVLAADNPVGKARASGKPSLVDFGSKGCRPCDMLAPILETLKKKYDGQANVVFVSVREEQILASRYGIQSIPVQIFFDKDGKEVFRHTGFWPQEELEKKLAEMGVK